MAKCCGSNPSTLVVAKAGDKTCRVNTQALKVFNTFNLNKQQESKKNNTLDFLNLKSSKTFAKDAVRAL